MKALVISFLFLLPCSLLAQKMTLDPQTSAISYEEVVMADSLKAAEILNLAKRWAIDTYGAGKDMIDYYDENELLMVIKPIITANTSSTFGSGLVKVAIFNTYTFYYRLQVETKNGRYRISANNFLCTLKQENMVNHVPTTTDKVEAHKLLFFNEDAIRSGAKAAFPGRERKQEEYVDMIKKEKTDLQQQFESKIKSTFDSLKGYISKPQKKDW